jgi:hypothetical protein
MRKDQQRGLTIGKGSRRLGSVLAYAYCYRTLTHIFPLNRSNALNYNRFSSNIINTLPNSSAPYYCLYKLKLSTHIYCRYYRTSTHVFTALPPTLLSTLRYFSLAIRHLLNLNAPIKPVIGCCTTVLPPTFLPFFQSLTYRALNHRGTALLPTFLRPDTVIWPTKCLSNFLSSLKFRMCKVVFKIDLKKTTSAMMSFFINSSRKLLT